MIEAYRIPIPKDRLRALSMDERVVLLLVGYVANQILIFQKLRGTNSLTNVTPDAIMGPLAQYFGAFYSKLVGYKRKDVMVANFIAAPQADSENQCLSPAVLQNRANMSAPTALGILSSRLKLKRAAAAVSAATAKRSAVRLR